MNVLKGFVSINFKGVDLIRVGHLIQANDFDTVDELENVINNNAPFFTPEAWTKAEFLTWKLLESKYPRVDTHANPKA